MSGGVLEAVAQIEPGEQLVAALCGLDVEQMRDDYDVLETVAAWEKVIAWAQARQLAAVAEFARRPWVIGPDSDETAWAKRGRKGSIERGEFADDEIAARLSISRFAASLRVAVGSSLAGTFEATARALESGRIDLAKARILLEGCAHVSVDVAREVEEQVLAKAPELTNGPFRQAVRRAVIGADPAAAAERARRSRDQREVNIVPLADELAEVRAVLPAVDAIAIDNALTAAARAMKAARGPDDVRTMDQLRADALVAPFAAALRSGVLEGGDGAVRLAKLRGCPAQVNVTVPASVLLGISGGPGELAGYGPVSAETAREIAADATWRRILTDPIDGTALHVGSQTYRPPIGLDRFVKARDGSCRFPGCNWPSYACDLDHTVSHPQGGTCADNLGPLCRRHHRCKHAGTGAGSFVQLSQATPGVFTWIMPTGHVYTVRPRPLAPPIAEELRSRAP